MVAVDLLTRLLMADPLLRRGMWTPNVARKQVMVMMSLSMIVPLPMLMRNMGMPTFSLRSKLMRRGLMMRVVMTLGSLMRIVMFAAVI
jgi:hypothetical protein